MIQIGYFGKTIHRGDFVRFNLPKAFITVMDDWLQNVLILGEATHASDWPTLYANWQDYRFHWSANVAGDSAWAGIVSSSTDKVGRRFPFCICACLPDTTPPSWNQSVLDDFFYELNLLLQSIRQSNYDFDQLQSTLANMAETRTVSVNQEPCDSHSKSERYDADHFSLLTSGKHLSNDSRAAASILDVVLKQTYFNYSIWTPLDNTSDAKGVVTSGLPEEKLALAMFNRQWSDVSIPELISAPRAAAMPHTDTLIEPVENALANDSINTSNMRQEISINTDSDVDIDFPKDDDWSALENLDTSSNPEPGRAVSRPGERAAVLKPQVETLELDEDSTTTAPWD